MMPHNYEPVPIPRRPLDPEKVMRELERRLGNLEDRVKWIEAQVEVERAPRDRELDDG